jgi:hypothetical protein
MLKYEPHTFPWGVHGGSGIKVALRRKDAWAWNTFKVRPTFGIDRGKFSSTNMVQEVRHGQQPETGQGRAQRHGSQ